MKKVTKKLEDFEVVDLLDNAIKEASKYISLSVIQKITDATLEQLHEAKIIEIEKIQSSDGWQPRHEEQVRKQVEDNIQYLKNKKEQKAAEMEAYKKADLIGRCRADDAKTSAE